MTDESPTPPKTPTEPEPPATQQQAGLGDPSQAARSRRPRDMVISMLVLLVPIALVLAFFQYIGGDREVTVVDPDPAIGQARRAGLAVAEPHGLSDGWRTTSAVTRTKGSAITLRIGYVTPSGGFVQLVESDAEAASLLRRELAGVRRPDGQLEIRGEQWQTYPGRGEERALVLMQPDRTILVLGKAPASELRTLAASLR